MDEILQKILGSEVLSEEVKEEITKKWKTIYESKFAELKEQALLEVRAELAEQWTQERDALVDSIEQFIDTQITEEVSELNADIQRFRDLEAEKAAEIVAIKAEMADKLKEDLDQLVDKIDDFFEVRLTEEFEELQEDIAIVKESQFGRKIMEAFAAEYANNFVDEESVQTQLKVTESKLQDAAKKIANLEKEQSKLIREQKLNQVLQPLSGSKREQMAFILQTVETERLEEAYGQFIGRVLKEEKAPAPINESKESKDSKETKLVTGEEKINEDTQKSSSKFDALRELAGIGK